MSNPPAPIESLRTNVFRKLRLAPHAPSPGWHTFSLLLLLSSILQDGRQHFQRKTSLIFSDGGHHFRTQLDMTDVYMSELLCLTSCPALM